MLGENKDVADFDDDDDEFEEFEDTTEMEVDAKSSNVGDPSVELNVDDLVAELEADMGIEPRPPGGNARKRLEELLEERRAARELDEWDEFAADDV